MNQGVPLGKKNKEKEKYCEVIPLTYNSNWKKKNSLANEIHHLLKYRTT